MRVLLYGGSFDPPHYGHLNNLRAAGCCGQCGSVGGGRADGIARDSFRSGVRRAERFRNGEAMPVF